MTFERTPSMVAFSAPLALRPGAALHAPGRQLCAASAPSAARARLPRRPRIMASALGESTDASTLELLTASPPALARPGRIGVVAMASATKAETTTSEQAQSGGGFLGVKARAYWESIGVIPLTFAGLGILALAIKAVKVMQGRWTSSDGVNRAMTAPSIITTEEQERELHVFKCGNCGYEMYPARGREFKFFPDNFKCPLCGAPKSAFWDLKDPNDPRNQDDDEDDELQAAGVDDNTTPGGAVSGK